MARFRLLVGLSLTAWSPLRRSPSEMCSTRTRMRKRVEFPRRDGPTRMTNSPSAMSRLASFTASVPSAYRLVTWLMVISAMAPSAFDGAGGEAGDDAALEDQHHDDDGDGDDDGGGGDRTRRLLEL